MLKRIAAILMAVAMMAGLGGGVAHAANKFYMLDTNGTCTWTKNLPRSSWYAPASLIFRVNCYDYPEVAGIMIASRHNNQITHTAVKYGNHILVDRMSLTKGTWYFVYYEGIWCYPKHADPYIKWYVVGASTFTVKRGNLQ